MVFLQGNRLSSPLWWVFAYVILTQWWHNAAGLFFPKLRQPFDLCRRRRGEYFCMGAVCLPEQNGEIGLEASHRDIQHQKNLDPYCQGLLQRSTAFLHQVLEGEANNVKINMKSRNRSHDLHQQDWRNLNNGLYSSLWSWFSRLHL